MRLLIGSNNTNKIKELTAAAKDFTIKLISPEQLRAERKLTRPPVPLETAATYEENAKIKARAFSLWSGLPVIADDSGLEVDALGGRPGVHSGRYAGEDATDEQRNQKLLEELDQAGAHDPKSRSARFRCSIVVWFPGGRVESAETILEGRILSAPRGGGGFGYDPVVLITELDKTLAEVPFEVTLAQGFRAKALRAVLERIVAK
jgi:XTP/dITP diphosphohydrolase